MIETPSPALQKPGQPRNPQTINLRALSRAKNLLAATCREQAESAESDAEREHLIEVARLAGGAP